MEISSIDKISLSILDLEMNNLDKNLAEFKELGIKNIHIDIIDTSFADNISFSLKTVNEILKYDFSFELHIMIENPLKILSKLNVKKNTKITVHSHVEEVRNLFLGRKDVYIGYALNPKDKIETIKRISCQIDYVLVMTVYPGFGKQAMIEECTEKIKSIKNLKIPVGVDGGVNQNNVHLVREADYIVIGSALTIAGDKRQVLEQIISGL